MGISPGEGVFAGSSLRERERLDFIDALRGFACLWVLLHHSFESIPAVDGLNQFPFTLVVTFAKAGWLGVSLFLVLSGFCLYYPFVRRSPPDGVKLDLRKFVRRRAIRILPPYFAAVALFTGLAWCGSRNAINWPETVRLPDVAAHAVLLHNLRPSTFASINPALWSLALEVQLYILFPFLVLLTARRGLKALAAATFALALAWQSVAWIKYGFSTAWRAEFAVAYHALPARCFEFAAGMIAAAIVARREGSARIPALLLILLIGPAGWFVLHVSRFGPLCDQAWGVIFASSVILLSKAPESWFRLGLLRALAWFGTVSYSVYLVHQPFIQFLAPEHLRISVTGTSSLLVFALVRMVIVSALGLLFFHLLEKPCIVRAARPPQRHPAPVSATEPAYRGTGALQ